jgi:hypothetical protein
MAKMKVDLSILKRLVTELANSLDSADQLKSSQTATMADYVTEMSKAAGLAAGIIQEGSFLVGDIQTAVRYSQQPAPAKSDDFLDKILSGIKGGSGSTN